MTSQTKSEKKYHGFMITIHLNDLPMPLDELYSKLDAICNHYAGGPQMNLWASMIHGRCMTALGKVLTGDHVHAGLDLKKSQIRISTLAKKIGIPEDAITPWQKSKINNLWAYIIEHATTTALSKQHFSDFEKKYHVHGNFDVLSYLAKVSPKIEKNLSDAERLLKRFSNRDITYDEFKANITTYDQLRLRYKIQKVLNIHHYQDFQQFQLDHQFKPLKTVVLAGSRLDKDLLARQLAKSKGCTYCYSSYDKDFFNDYHGERALIVKLPSDNFLKINEKRDSKKLQKIKTMLANMIYNPNDHNYCYNAPYGRKVYLMIDMVIFIVDTPLDHDEDYSYIAPPLPDEFKKIQYIYQTTEDYSKLEQEIGYGTVYYLEKEGNKKDQRPIDQITDQWDDGQYIIHANRQSDNDDD